MGSQEQAPDSQPTAPAPFIFDLECYTGPERVEMLDYCIKKFSYPATLRKPTVLEMRIIQGLVEGTIIARRLPQFLRRCSNLDALVRMQSTICAQIEGELVGSSATKFRCTPIIRTLAELSTASSCRHEPELLRRPSPCP